MWKRRRRPDGREADQLRPLAAEFGIIDTADGSAQLSIGDTRVLVAVYGPRAIRSMRAENPFRATVDVTVASDAGAQNRDVYLEYALESVLSRTILLDAYPRCVIHVVAHVVHDDGGAAAAVLNCATLALASAGVPLRWLVGATTVGWMASDISAERSNGSIDEMGSSSQENTTEWKDNRNTQRSILCSDLLANEEAVAEQWLFAAFRADDLGQPLLLRGAGSEKGRSSMTATTHDTSNGIQFVELMAAAGKATATMLAFLQLALKEKLARDAVNFVDLPLPTIPSTSLIDLQQ